MEEIFDAEGDAVVGSGAVSGLDGFTVAGDEAEDSFSVDDEDIKGVPVGLLPLAGEIGAVVANVFAAEIILDAGVQVLLGLEGLIEEGSGILCAEQMSAQEEDGGAGRNRTDE